MQISLESPCEIDSSDWDRLYRARGEEVTPYRPYFTGDVFEKVETQVKGGRAKERNVIILQHPCALRADGVNLVSGVLVAEVRDHKPIGPAEWAGYGKLFPLPDLVPTATSRKRNQAALFDSLYIVEPEDLIDKRIACLSQVGVNLVMQRWVHHNSRVVVPSWNYNDVTSSAFEEADLLEEWCEEREGADDSINASAMDCVTWLREEVMGGVTRQKLLEDPQNRSSIRSQMRKELRARASQESASQ